MKKASVAWTEAFWNNSLTMSYFHTGTRNIIGAEAFHCPVRDGKEWDHLAMVARHNGPPLHSANWANPRSRPHGCGNQILDGAFRAKNGPRARLALPTAA